MVQETAVVPVKSAWSSKVNWTQAVGGLAMIIAFATGGALNLSAEDQAAIVTVIGLVQGVVTWILKTWYSPAVHPASLTDAH